MTPSRTAFQDRLTDRKKILSNFAAHAANLLVQDDPELAVLLAEEYVRQQHTLAMVAASSIGHPSVLACEGSVLSNLTTEGYPGARYHAGCVWADEVERLAIHRAKKTFGAQYANVQPHSGTSANEIVIFNLLSPGDAILSLGLSAGGHLSHGAKASVVGKYFGCISYGVTHDGLIDYDEVERLAEKHRPRLIICGASAYPRVINFARFREIADQVGAYVLADISHIAGLVAARLHPSPVDDAHFTTTSTYKQLFGPRGGLIMMGKDYGTAMSGNGRLSRMIDRATFPGFQGTPDLGAIAAKARALEIAGSPFFYEWAKRVVACARSLSALLQRHGYTVLTGGTDNHMVLIDLRDSGLTGAIAEKALESVGVIVNKNQIPGDQRPPLITSGLRIGTNNVALRGMGEAEMLRCSEIIHTVLSAVTVRSDSEFDLKAHVRAAAQAMVQELCDRFPIPQYPPPPKTYARIECREGGPG